MQFNRRAVAFREGRGKGYEKTIVPKVARGNLEEKNIPQEGAHSEQEPREWNTMKESWDRDARKFRENFGKHLWA